MSQLGPEHHLPDLPISGVNDEVSGIQAIPSASDALSSATNQPLLAAGATSSPLSQAPPVTAPAASDTPNQSILDTSLMRSDTNPTMATSNDPLPHKVRQHGRISFEGTYATWPLKFENEEPFG